MKRVVALLPVLVALQVGVSPALAWTWPVDGPVLRPFVLGDDPYAAGQHRGIDVGTPAGEPVHAPEGGTVSFAGTVPSGGRTVTVRTEDGYSVTLVHLGSIAVATGAAVSEGDALGTVGPSGDPEHAIPYVHLGVRLTADPTGYLDPLGLLPARAGEPASEPVPAPTPEPTSVPTVPAEPVPPAAEVVPAAREPKSQPEPKPVAVPAPAAQPAAEPAPMPPAQPAQPLPAQEPAAQAARPPSVRPPEPKPVVTPPLTAKEPAPAGTWSAPVGGTPPAAEEAPTAVPEAHMPEGRRGRGLDAGGEGRTPASASEPEGTPASTPRVAAVPSEADESRSGLRGLEVAVAAGAALALALAGRAALVVRRRELGDALAADRSSAVLLDGGRPAAEDAQPARLAEDDALVLDRDLERILLGQAEPLADLDRDDDASELVDVPDDPARSCNSFRAPGCAHRYRTPRRSGAGRVSVRKPAGPFLV